MVDLHGSQCGFCTPGFVMALFALYHRADARPVDRRARQRLDRRQSLPLHRLSADRRCGARRLRGAARATGSPPRSRDARRALAELKDGEDIFIGDDERFFAAPASIDVARRALLRASRRDHCRRRDRRRAVGHQAAARPAQGHLARPRRGLDEIEDRRDAVSFGAMRHADAEAMPYLAAIDRDLGELMRRFAGTQVRIGGTVGGNIANGSPIGDTAAGADRARRDARAAARRAAAHAAAGGLLPRLRQAGPRSRANSCAWCAIPKFGAGEHLPLLQDLQALRPGHFRRDGRVQAAPRRHAHRGRAHRLRRHGGDPEARAQRREGADRDAISTGRKRWDEAVAALAQDFSPIDDHAGERRLSPRCRARAAAQGADRDRRRLDAHARASSDSGEAADVASA